MTSSFVRKAYLRTKYLESNIEEDIDTKNQFRIKNIPYPSSIGEPASKMYAANKFNDPSKIRNFAHVDLDDKNLDNVCFRTLISYPAIGECAGAKFYVE